MLQEMVAGNLNEQETWVNRNTVSVEESLVSSKRIKA